jgi:hypothetical protein
MQWGLAKDVCFCWDSNPYSDTALTELSLNQRVLVASESVCFHMCPGDLLRRFLGKMFYI